MKEHQALQALVLALCLCAGFADARETWNTAMGHYLLVWAGDRAQKGNDFLAVIDADPTGSPGLASGEGIGRTAGEAWAHLTGQCSRAEATSSGICVSRCRLARVPWRRSL